MSQEALATAVGVKYQSVQEWEREGGTAPHRKRHGAVAAALGVTVHELLTGERVPARGEGDSPEVERLIRAFSWLMEDEQAELLKTIEAKAATNKVIAKQLGPRFRVASDAEYEAVLRKSGDFPPGAKKKRAKPGPKRQPGTAMDDFLDEG